MRQLCSPKGCGILGCRAPPLRRKAILSSGVQPVRFWRFLLFFFVDHYPHIPEPSESSRGIVLTIREHDGQNEDPFWFLSPRHRQSAVSKVRGNPHGAQRGDRGLCLLKCVSERTVAWGWAVHCRGLCVTDIAGGCTCAARARRVVGLGEQSKIVQTPSPPFFLPFFFLPPSKLLLCRPCT